jgi:hypothetical protein
MMRRARHRWTEVRTMTTTDSLDITEPFGAVDRFTLFARVRPGAGERVLLRSADREPLLSVAPLEAPQAYRERRRCASSLALTFTWRTDTVELLVFDDLADICIDGRYTHLGFAPESPDSLLIECLAGDVRLEGVTLRPLVDRP